MRNYFSVIRSVGLIFFAFGIAFVGVTLVEVINTLDRRNNFYDDEFYFVVTALLMGLGFLVVGLAGLLKAKWFPTVGIIMLVISFLYFNWIVIVEILPNLRFSLDEVLGVGALVMIFYVLIISFTLLLRNEHFLEALKTEDKNKEVNDRILDAE